MENLQCELEAELSMDGSGELGGKIMKDFDPLFDRIVKEIESRPKEELDAYIDENAPEEDDYPDVAPWDKDDTDPAGGSGLASHV